MKSSIAPRSVNSVDDLHLAQRHSDRRLFIIIFAIVFGLTPLLTLAGEKIGFSTVVGLSVVLAVVVLIVRWPVLGLYVVAGCALLVEADPLVLNGHPAYSLYVFYWPPRYAGLIERPIGFLLLFIFLMVLCQRLVKRQGLLQGGKLFLPFLFFLLCVAGGIVHGLISGGDFKIIVVEVRPFWYLFLSYLLAYNLVQHKDHVRLLFWLVIVSAGIKSLEGVYIYLVVYHAGHITYNELMAHEESFFFAALLLLVILFCLHYRYRPQLYAALLIVAPVLIALVANKRRADYIALLVGFIVAWVLVIVAKPHARKGLIIALVIFAVLIAGYVAAFSNAGGILAEPARAITSLYHPDPRDALSNLYREIENYDLKYTAKVNPLGLGFGKEFLQPYVLPNILAGDPYYLYIPHNTIYWVWMRLGVIGFCALLYLIAAIIVRGCLIVRQLRDRYLQLVAIYVVAITFMEVFVAYADYQLFYYRNVIYLGLLIGILMKLPSLDREKEQPVHENSHRVRPAAASGQRGG